jgi:glycosyltransferase involved in cell wall biosynthesis
MATPAVTVLMPVYNGARFLAGAMESVLGQTFGDFELLAINDGSSDQTAEILASSRDPRVRIVENGRNLGLIASLNKGLDLARGDYVARMDQDDLALPKRLEKQVHFLSASPRTGLCGTWFRTFGGTRSTVVRPPARADDMAARLFYESPLAHPTVMFRRALFAEHGLRYSHEYPHAEDYELWTRVAGLTELANLPEVLLQYRRHDEQVSTLKKAKQDETVRKILLRQLGKIHPHSTEAERDTHAAIVSSWIPDKVELELDYVESWLRGLIRRNETLAAFPPEAFRRALAIVWWRHCSARFSVPGTLGAFYASELTRVLPLKNKLGALALRAGLMAPRS